MSPRGFSIGHWTCFNNEVNRLDFFAQFLLSCDTKKEDRIFGLSASKYHFKFLPTYASVSTHIASREPSSALIQPHGTGEEMKKERNWNNTKVFRFVKEVFLLRRASEKKIARLSSYLSKENHTKQSQGAFALRLVPRARNTATKIFSFEIYSMIFPFWLWQFWEKLIKKIHVCKTKRKTSCF